MKTITPHLHWQTVSLSEYVLPQQPSGQMDRITKYLQDAEVQSVLDAGCWEGRNSFDLLRRNFHVTGVDISQEALNRCRRRMHQERLHFPVFYQKDEVLPFSDSQFDAVLSWRVLHNIADALQRRQMIAELMRVVRPGGILVASVRSIENLQSQYPRSSIQSSGAGFKRFYYKAADLQTEFTTKQHTVLDCYTFTEPETYNGTVYHTVYWNLLLQKSSV